METLKFGPIFRISQAGKPGLGGLRWEPILVTREGRSERMGSGKRSVDWLHLNPVTINPVIRMSRLGPFFCPRNSELLSEQFRDRSLQPFF